MNQTPQQNIPNEIPYFENRKAVNQNFAPTKSYVWTGFAKTILYIAWVCMAIGGFVAGIIAEDVLIAFLGLLGGILGGAVIVSFSMVIIEILEKLTDIYEELKRKK